METREYKGLWWLPENPEHKVAGILYYTPGEELRLELIGSFDVQHPVGIAAIMNVKREDVIWGQASDGTFITLLDNGCKISHRGSAEFSTVVYSAREVAIGLHIDSVDEKRFFMGMARIPELSYFLYPAAVEQIWTDTEKGHGIYIKYEDPKQEEREVGKTDVGNGLSISLCRNASFSSGEFSFKPTFEQYTSLLISSIEPVSFKQLYEAIVRYERFLSLATLREVGYTELHLYSEDYKVRIGDGNYRHKPVIVDTTFHQKPSDKKIDRYKFLFAYEQISERYSEALKKWYTEDEQFNAIRGHFLDSIDYHGPFSYINFLVAIQAVEGYGRRYLGEEIKEYRKTLNGEQKKKALLNILTTVFSQYQGVRKVKQDTNLEAIVEARNYHSHLLPRKGQPLINMEDLYYLTDELRKVLVCCVLSYLGFTVAEIDGLTNSSNNELFQDW